MIIILISPVRESDGVLRNLPFRGCGRCPVTGKNYFNSRIWYCQQLLYSGIIGRTGCKNVKDPENAFFHGEPDVMTAKSEAIDMARLHRHADIRKEDVLGTVAEPDVL